MIHSQKQSTNLQNAYQRYYVASKNDLAQLYNILSGKDFEDWWKNLFTKARDSISSIRIYPFKNRQVLTDLVRSDFKYVLGKKWDGIGGWYIPQTMKSYLVGEYDFENPSSFIDLQPYTHIQLYLPYIDFIDLPVDEIVGGKLEIYYAFDLATGTASVFIELIKNNQRYMIATKSGKIAVDVAWGSDSTAENTRNVINSILSTAVTIFALQVGGGINEVAQIGRKVGTASALGKGALSIGNSLQLRYNRGGVTSSVTGTMSPSHPYLIIKKPKLVPVNEEDYARTYGKPLYESRVLTQMKGFTIVDEIHLEHLGNATEPEMREIENLLKTGVHL